MHVWDDDDGGTGRTAGGALPAVHAQADAPVVRVDLRGDGCRRIQMQM